MISIIQDSNINYPSDDYDFSPDEPFPEYQFQHISNEPNKVYKAVRDCLAQAGLDKNNYGTPLWNPFRDTIFTRSNVFVLCNFVYNKRVNEKQNDFFAKCTHGSVLRAVLDYVLIAVGKSGKVRFGNAPVQSCNWEKVLEETGALRVVDFYKRNTNHIVESCDLRSYTVKADIFGGITTLKKGDSQNEVEVDIGKYSLLDDLYRPNNHPKFASLDYDRKLTERYHGQNKHIYVLNKKILEADVIVSIPKLKTHEKVGVTLGIKGCVGAIAHKHCLAHFRIGAPENGGDEYQNGQWLNRLESRIGSLVNVKRTPFYNNCIRIINVAVRRFIKRVIGRNIGGGWSGNDTTWRMSMDIARILKYADKAGALKVNEMRKMICLVDGILGGEGNGPLSPTAKACGFLSYSDDLAVGDCVAASFIGMDCQHLPIIKQAFSLTEYGLTNVKIHEIKCIINGEMVDYEKLTSMKVFNFKMPAGWRR